MELFNKFATETPSGIGALGVDGKAFVVQLITFLLAFLVLKKFAFKPILKVMSERRQTIEDGVKLGEKMQKEEASLEAKIEKTLAKARLEADGILADAQESARQVVREAEDKAKQKASLVMEDARSHIDQDMARARKKLEKELVSLVSDATEAIIKEKVDSSKDTELIEQMLEEQRA